MHHWHLRGRGDEPAPHRKHAVIRQDFREKLDKEQADKYQSLIGVVYLLAGVLACAVNLFADGKIYMVGMLAAVLVLVLGSVLCNRKFLPREKK